MVTLPLALTVVLVAFAVAPHVLEPPRRPIAESAPPSAPITRTGRTGRRTRSILTDRIATMRRDRRPGCAEVADWCDELARVVRSGGSLHHAIGSTPVSRDLERGLRPTLLALERGDALADALAVASAIERGERGSDPLRQVMVVLRVAATAGGRTAEIVDRCAASLRDRVAAAAERHAHTAQARLSAAVLSALPVVVLLLTVGASTSARAALSGPIGLVALPTGLALNAAGWWWMRRILRGST